MTVSQRTEHVVAIFLATQFCRHVACSCLGALDFSRAYLAMNIAMNASNIPVQPMVLYSAMRAAICCVVISVIARIISIRIPAPEPKPIKILPVVTWLINIMMPPIMTVSPPARDIAVRTEVMMLAVCNIAWF